jgi:hypothetical protein
MKALEPFSNVKHVNLDDSQYQKERHPTTIKDAEDHECSKDILTSVGKFFSSLAKYQHKKPLKDLGTQTMTTQKNLARW